MKLTFKDLKQQKFVIDAESSETIGEVKEKISKEKGWEASQQKLIYSGKILQDANTVESYSIEEKGFIVCMISKVENPEYLWEFKWYLQPGKPKAPPPNPTTIASSATIPPATPAQQVTRTPAIPAAPAPASASDAPLNIPATPSPTTRSTTAAITEDAHFNDPSALALGAARAAAVANMESMGFPRADIDRAMRAAFYNPDRAVEYLLNGIPENLQPEQGRGGASGDRSATPAAAPSTASSNVPATAPAEPPVDTSDQPVNLFEAAAQAGRGAGGGGRPAAPTVTSLLQETLRAGAGAGVSGTGTTGAGATGASGGAGGAGLGNLDFLRTNTQFQQLRGIVQQQPQMLEPILQQVSAGNPQLAQLIGQYPDQFLQLLSEDSDVPLPPGAQEISVTEPERAAIERLCLLGFERDMVIQAYFACDKNEELAANFLFEQPDEGDDI